MVIKAIILIGGAGLRFGHDIPKQFLNLSGKAVYLHALATFLSFQIFEEIILVCHKSWIEKVQQDISNPRIRVIEGGHTRQSSSYKGLLAAGKDTDYVMIHDGVRPLVSKQIIENHLLALTTQKAINTCIPSFDTIVHTSNSNTIDRIPNRLHYLRGQTPQSFSYPFILEAHEKAKDQKTSDDCSLIVRLGYPVHVVLGTQDNIKITGELDLFLAEQLMRTRTHSLAPGSLSLKGKVFIITGGTGGIGFALAQRLTKEGAIPIILSRSSPDYPVDLTHFQKAALVFDQIYRNYGQIDGLINCVGLLKIQPFLSLDHNQLHDLITTNLHTLLYSCRLAKIKPKGHIINLSSSAFSHGRKGYAIYSATKAAVVNFTQALAAECEDLHINAIIPQRTNTQLRQHNFPHENPSSLLSPEKVAESILSLLKQQGITGTSIEVRK